MAEEKKTAFFEEEAGKETEEGLPETNTEEASSEKTKEPSGEQSEAGGAKEESEETGDPAAEAEEADEAGTEEEDAEEDGKAEGAADGRKGKQKGSFFGKKKKETEKLLQQIDELSDRLKRSLAEFDNYRKRTEKEKSSMYIIGAKDVVEKILPVVDNFERGLAQAPEGDAFADGMKLVYKQLLTTLEDLGVKPIEAVGKEFDPAFHNAVMHVEDDSVGENIIVEEFQKGYTYKDFVVRHSMVKVAN